MKSLYTFNIYFQTFNIIRYGRTALIAQKFKQTEILLHYLSLNVDIELKKIKFFHANTFQNFRILI